MHGGRLRGSPFNMVSVMIRPYASFWPASRHAFLVAFFLVSLVRAQQSPPSPAVPQTQADPSSPQPSQSTTNQPGDQTQQQREIERQEKTGTSDDRLFWALPDFLTVQNAANIPTLSTGEKFKVVARGSFDWVEFPWYGFLAGLSQAENSEPGYGQGAEGYGKRYGAYFADGTIENFMTEAVLPSILKQDPRYYQLGEGSFLHRTEYAVSRIFVTRSDSKTTQFNFSEIVGSAMAAFASTYTYHPRGDRTVPNTLSVWGSEVGYDTITYVVKEFWPDIKRHFTKK